VKDCDADQSKTTLTFVHQKLGGHEER